MGENSRFDFCPKCGALAKDGICQSCGYQNQEIIQLLQAEAVQTTPELPTMEQMTPEPPTMEQTTPEQLTMEQATAEEQQLPVAEQSVSQEQPAAQQPGQEQQNYGQLNGQAYGQPGNPAQPTDQQQSYYGGQPQGYYTGQSAGQAQGYYGGAQFGQPQSYYTQQSTGQPQSYYGGQPGGQPQSYYGGQQAGQPQNYYTGQQTGQPQNYYTGQQAGQSQGYYTGQQVGQSQGYYTGQQTGQSQGYYTGQQTGQPQNYYTGQQANQSQSYYGGQQANQSQGYYGGQQAGQIQQPYSGYAPAVPPEAAGGKTNKGTVVALCVILGVVLLAVIILILVGLYNLQEDGKDRDRDRDRDRETSEEYKEDDEDDNGVVTNGGNSPYDYTYEHSLEDVTAANWNEEGQDDSLPFYSGPYNALLDDLSYEISFTNESYYALDTGVVISISVEYPQIISENITHVDRLNEQLRYEYDYYYELFEDDFKPLMSSASDYYLIDVDSYVTYMDEDILSVVYAENIYVSLENDPFGMINYFCVNIDLKTGKVLQNTEILNVDEDFVASLRERELIENESRVLGDYSDEEIIAMLKDEEDMVFFYTPMGIEVGLNLGQRVIYFMYLYDDYQQYLNIF